MASRYVPERNHIVWPDFEPTKGREIGKYRPALVLSSREYNRKTGLLICCPISTSIRGGLTEVPLNNLDRPNHRIKSDQVFRDDIHARGRNRVLIVR